MRRELETLQHYLNKTHNSSDGELEVRDAISFLDKEFDRLDTLESQVEAILAQHPGLKYKLQEQNK